MHGVGKDCLRLVILPGGSEIARAFDLDVLITGSQREALPDPSRRLLLVEKRQIGLRLRNSMGLRLVDSRHSHVHASLRLSKGPLGAIAEDVSGVDIPKG